MQFFEYIRQHLCALILGALIGAVVGGVAARYIGGVPLPAGTSFELCSYEVQTAVPSMVSPREVARNFTTLRAQKQFKQEWMEQTPAWMYLYSRHDGYVYALIGTDSPEQQTLAQQQLAAQATQFFKQAYSSDDGTYTLVQQQTERIGASDAATILAPVFCAWVVTFSIATAALCVAIALYAYKPKDRKPKEQSI